MNQIERLPVGNNGDTLKINNAKRIIVTEDFNCDIYVGLLETPMPFENQMIICSLLSGAGALIGYGHDKCAANVSDHSQYTLLPQTVPVQTAAQPAPQPQR